MSNPSDFEPDPEPEAVDDVVMIDFPVDDDSEDDD